VAVARQTIDITNSALEAYCEGKNIDSKDYESTLHNRWRAYDTLSVALLSTGDREVCTVSILLGRETDSLGFHHCRRANASECLALPDRATGSGR
jgi:hypothetical protein